MGTLKTTLVLSLAAMMAVFTLSGSLIADEETDAADARANGTTQSAAAAEESIGKAAMEKVRKLVDSAGTVDAKCGTPLESINTIDGLIAELTKEIDQLKTEAEAIKKDLAPKALEELNAAISAGEKSLADMKAQKTYLETLCGTAPEVPPTETPSAADPYSGIWVEFGNKSSPLEPTTANYTGILKTFCEPLLKKTHYLILHAEGDAGSFKANGSRAYDRMNGIIDDMQSACDQKFRFWKTKPAQSDFGTDKTRRVNIKLDQVEE